VDEDPADVRVQQPAQGAAPAVAVVDVRAVRVALLVGERVVLAMVGDPRDHGPLDRGRAQRRQRSAQPAVRLERAVGQVAVEADGDPQGRQGVDDPEDHEVVPMQRPLPELPCHEPERQEGHARHEAGDDPVARLVGDRLDVVADGS
jgi:hypothetical protein